jgi:hypothetical protein
MVDNSERQFKKINSQARKILNTREKKEQEELNKLTKQQTLG